ncbi:hypothetical protein NFI96_007307 [Prochilodus magdalenae]|nr:hypothetical protein NFI96_007307 [Prochilodus magdalenae]
MALEGNASCADCVSQSARNSSPGAQAASGPVTGTLAGILIFTIVVDIVGNLLVILSVCRNKKLRNADMYAPASRMKHHIRPDLAEASVTLGLDSAAAAKKSVLWGLLSPGTQPHSTLRSSDKAQADRRTGLRSTMSEHQQ